MGVVLSSPASTPRPADVVVVLGGDAGDRYLQGRALVLAGPSQRTVLIHANPLERKDPLLRLPGIEMLFEDEPRNSWDEGLPTQAWYGSRGQVRTVMSPNPRSRHRAAWIVLLGFLLLPEAALLGYFTVGALLACPAGSPRHADLVVVLGGSADRYPRARDLVLAGYSKRLLLINSGEFERKDAQARLPGVEILIDDLPRSSWDEAQRVRARMQAMGWHTALVVSDPPHLLRVAYAWSSAFRGTDLSYTLISTDPPWWPGWRWWRNPYATTFVGDEVLKLGYYVLHYRFGL